MTKIARKFKRQSSRLQDVRTKGRTLWELKRHIHFASRHFEIDTFSRNHTDLRHIIIQKYSGSDSKLPFYLVYSLRQIHGITVKLKRPMNHKLFTNSHLACGQKRLSNQFKRN